MLLPEFFQANLLTVSDLSLKNTYIYITAKKKKIEMTWTYTVKKR